MRIVLLTAPAIAAAVVFGGAACSAAPAPKHIAPASAAASVATGGDTSVAAAACRTGDVEGVIAARPDRSNGNTRMAVITLTNKSGRTCAVDGWASIALVNAAGDVVRVPTTEVNQPGAPVRTTLRRGTTAWAGIKWTACDKGDGTCGAGNTLRFSLQAATGGDVARLVGFPEPADSAVTMKDLQVGSIQPLRIDVARW